jgi:16S rRNA (guanine966-N2)-methyltransferase
MVRIVGGRYRGKQLSVPKGDGVRPTTDRVREALFNVLDHRFDRPYDGARVLDLFAGAGALGLEALSRGAAHVCFVERNREVAANLRKNLKTVREHVDIVERDAIQFLSGRCQTPFDFVFMDPPYDKELLAPCLEAVIAKGWLIPQGLVCVEQPSESGPVGISTYTELFARRYGRTTISLLSPRRTP